MSVRLKLWAGFAAVAVGGVAIWACNQNGASNGSDTSVVNLAISGGDFTGNSVDITGTRGATADSKYRCNSSFEQCFNLSGTNPVVSVGSLCPSNDIPDAGWTFVYKVYSAPCDAGGVLLNDPNVAANPNNFECYDSHDVFSQLFPNETFGETILPGTNFNSIACLTTNATKNFSFSACAINQQSSTELSLDCGCTPSGATCTCGALTGGDGGNLQSNDAGTCVLDPDAGIPCSVICCSSGLSSCSGTCVNKRTDSANCGACGTVCDAGHFCDAGACQ